MSGLIEDTTAPSERVSYHFTVCDVLGTKHTVTVNSTSIDSAISSLTISKAYIKTDQGRYLNERHIVWLAPRLNAD